MVVRFGEVDPLHGQLATIAGDGITFAIEIALEQDISSNFHGLKGNATGGEIITQVNQTSGAGASTNPLVA